MWHRGFAHPWLLLLSAVLPLVGLLTWFAMRRRRRALALLGSSLALRPLIDESPWLRALRRLCLSTGLSLLALGAAGPQWGRDFDQTVSPGRDMIVVLDMSRSMFAEAPPRLERARDGLEGLIDAMRQRGGHRVCLIVFAGEPRVVCPLTQDYDHVRHMLKELNTQAPTAELGHGTRIGQALELAVAVHLARQERDPGIRGHQDVLLVSDGDDPAEDDEWQGGLRAASRAKIPVYTVGVGDPAQDSPINVGGVPQKDLDGMVVLTRLREKPLAQIARETDATYTAAPTGVPELGDLFRGKIETRPAGEAGEDALPVYHQRYDLFLGPALGLLAFGLVLPENLPRRPRKEKKK
jgi:Ca-activated chloride channel family protein